MAAMRMTYDPKQKLAAITPDEFRAARSFMQTMMKVMIAQTPVRENEARSDHVARVHKRVLELNEKPAIIERMISEQGQYDFLLKRLGDIDADPKHLDVLYNNLVKFTNGEITAAEGVGKTYQGVDPEGYRQTERAILMEKLRADNERSKKLNIV